MIEPVHPPLGHRLNAEDRADIVRLAEVVPGDDLREWDGGAILYEHLPALRDEPVVSTVDPVLVVRVRTVVLSSHTHSSVQMGG